MTCINSISVTPKTLKMKVGTWYASARATISPSDASCCEIMWYSDNTAVANVNPTAGYIEAIDVGTAHIYAVSADGSVRSDNITVEVVEELEITAVQISNTSISIQEGDTYMLNASLRPEGATTTYFVWTSDDPSVATVNADGIVFAHKIGTTTVRVTTYENSGVYATCTVNVRSGADFVTITPCCLELDVGEGDILSATISPSSASDKCICWTSSNENVAKVNRSSGFVEAVGEGTATIYAHVCAGGNVFGSCSVTVHPEVPIQSLSISPSTKAMNVGETATLELTVCQENYTNKVIRWTTSDSNVVSLKNVVSGVITAKAAGTATIKAKVWGEDIEATCTVNVNQILTYSDTLIQNSTTREKIINFKTLIDENKKAYLSGKISLEDKNLIDQQLNTECDIVRADYIIVGDNPTSDYAFAVLGGDRSANILPFPFPSKLSLGSTGLSVIVVQRVLELMGCYEPKDSETYGTFDQATYDAALSYSPTLLQVDPETQQVVFDDGSFHELFQASTLSKRTYAAMTELNKLRVVHNIVATWSAGKVGGTYSMSENKIKNGNSTGTYYGYADVLKDTSSTSIGTYLWEVKPDNDRYYKLGGIGDRQIQRYINAGNMYEQEFTKPLVVGYNIGSFSIYITDNKCIDVRSYTGSLGDYRNGLILYKLNNTGTPAYEVETEPVGVPMPSKEYEFERQVVFNTEVFGTVVIVGIMVVATVVFLIIALKNGKFFKVPVPAAS